MAIWSCSDPLLYLSYFCISCTGSVLDLAVQSGEDYMAIWSCTHQSPCSSFPLSPEAALFCPSNLSKTIQNCNATDREIWRCWILIKRCWMHHQYAMEWGEGGFWFWLRLEKNDNHCCTMLQDPNTESWPWQCQVGTPGTKISGTTPTQSLPLLTISATLLLGISCYHRRQI